VAVIAEVDQVRVIAVAVESSSRVVPVTAGDPMRVAVALATRESSNSEEQSEQ
jgi:hypothetical protein